MRTLFRAPPDLFEVGNSRFRIQFFEDFICPWPLRVLSNLTVSVFQIAERNGLCGAGLGAGWRDLTISDEAVFVFCVIFALLNALYTEGAFFHHARFAHGDIRIELEM